MSNFITAVFDSVSNLLRVAEQNPLNQQYVSETVVEVASGDNVAGVDVYVNCNGYRSLSILSDSDASFSCNIAGTTETGDPSGLSFVDKTVDWFGSAQTGDFLKNVDVSSISYVKLTYTSGEGAGANDYKVVAYKSY